MTLVGYQRALADLIASPALCLATRAASHSTLAPYNLSERERARLEAAVAQRGMSTNCTLYRVNRMTPIYSYLPLTCFLLGDELITEAERFWSEGPPNDLQFGPETERFAAFLKRRVAGGEFADPYLEEVLELELAANRLQACARQGADAGERPTDDALTAVIEFCHDPPALLEALAERRRPKREPPRGHFLVEVDASGATMQLRQVEVAGC